MLENTKGYTVVLTVAAFLSAWGVLITCYLVLYIYININCSNCTAVKYFHFANAIFSTNVSFYRAMKNK